MQKSSSQWEEEDLAKLTSKNKARGSFICLDADPWVVFTRVCIHHFGLSSPSSVVARIPRVWVEGRCVLLCLLRVHFFFAFGALLLGRSHELVPLGQLGRCVSSGFDRCASCLPVATSPFRDSLATPRRSSAYMMSRQTSMSDEDDDSTAFTVMTG